MVLFLFIQLRNSFLVYCPLIFKHLRTLYILKRKSFATLTKMLVPFFGSKQTLSDNAIGKSLYLSCIQHKNQNCVAYGCRAATIILRQPPILKSHGYNTSHVMRKIFFSQYLFSNAEWKTSSNQVNLCHCQGSLRLRDAFNHDVIGCWNTTEHQ